MRIAIAVTLTAAERILLTTWSRGRSTPARLVLRAKMILAAAQGRENKDIAMELGCTRRTVGTWQNRFAEKRMVGIEADAPRVGPAFNCGQLRHSQAPQGAELAEASQAILHSLHTDKQFVAERHRTLVPRHYPGPYPEWRVQKRLATGAGDMIGRSTNIATRSNGS